MLNGILYFKMSQLTPCSVTTHPTIGVRCDKKMTLSRITRECAKNCVELVL